MLKQLRILPLCAVLGIILYGCNAGTDEGTVFINAQVTKGTCNYMSTGSTCEITISYNKGNESGLALSYTPSPLPSFIESGDFNTGISLCNQQISYSSANSGTCVPIIVKYQGSDETLSTNLMFMLGGKSSNIISVSGANI